MLAVHAPGRIDDEWSRTVTAAFQSALHRLDDADVLGDGGAEILLGEPRPARVLGEAMYDPDNERPRDRAGWGEKRARG